MTDYTPNSYFPPGYFPPDYFGGNAGGVIVGVLVGTAAWSCVVTGTLTDGAAVQATGGAWHVPYRKGERKARGLAWERRDRDLEKELRDVYAELTGELREVAPVAEIKAAVVPHATPTTAALPPVAAIDFEALARDLAAVRALLAAHEDAQREQEEEEAVTLLLMAA